jgi:transposase
MMGEKHQTYPVEFKREAVRLVTVHGYGVAEAARNLGRNATMVGRWKHAHEAREDGAFPGKGRLSPDLGRRQPAEGLIHHADRGSQ